jgi:hypothetical protein
VRYRLMASYLGASYQAAVGPSDRDVTLFAAPPPPEEHGFSPAPGGIWRKQVRLDDLDALWESRPIGSYHGEPCLVLDDLGDRLHIVYLGMDELRAAQLGYWEVDRGVFEVVVPRHEVSDLAEERHEFPVALLLSALPRALGAGNLGTDGPGGVGTGPNGAGTGRVIGALGPGSTAEAGPAAAGAPAVTGGQGPGAMPGWNGPPRAPSPARGQLPPTKPAQLPAAMSQQAAAAGLQQAVTGAYQAPAVQNGTGQNGMGQNGMGLAAGPAVPGALGGPGVPQRGNVPQFAGGQQGQAIAQETAAQPPVQPVTGPQVATAQAPDAPAAQAQPLQPPAPTAVAAWHGSPAPDGNWYYQPGPDPQQGAMTTGGYPVNGMTLNGYAQPDQGNGPGPALTGRAGAQQYAQPARPDPAAGYRFAQPTQQAVGPPLVRPFAQPAPQQAAPPAAQAVAAVSAEAAELTGRGAATGTVLPSGGISTAGTPAPQAPVPAALSPARGSPVIMPSPVPPAPAATATMAAPPSMAPQPAQPPLTAEPGAAQRPTARQAVTQPLSAPPAAVPLTTGPLTTGPAAPGPAEASAPGPLTTLPPASKPDQGSSPSSAAPAGALSKLTGAVRGRRAARKPRLSMSAMFADLVDMADISRSAYAVDEEITGAMCLFKTDGGYEVFSCAEDARHEVRFFEEEEAAYFYLFGVLAAEALRNGRLSPRRT